nr:hypothetical protein [Tanacetum cinerariifolium]
MAMMMAVGVIMAWCSGCHGEGGVAVVVAAAWGCSGDVVVELWRPGWRVMESGVEDRLDRVVGSIFGFTENAHRKTFPAAAVWWPAGGGWPAGGVAGYLAVLGCIQPTGSTRMYRDLSLRTSDPK